MAERVINKTDIFVNIFELKKDMYSNYQHAESKTRNFIFQSSRDMLNEMIIAYSAMYAETDNRIKLEYIKKLENLTMSLKAEFNILAEKDLINKKHLFNMTEARIMPLENSLAKFKNCLQNAIK